MKLKIITSLLLFTNYLCNSQNVLNIQALENYTQSLTNLYVEGYYNSGDGGGGYFYLKTSSEPVNKGTVFESTNPAKRWFRIVNDNKVNVRWFGVKGDGNPFSSNATLLDTAKDYAVDNGYALYFPSGTYHLGSSSLFTKRNNSSNGLKSIIGDGKTSVITGNNLGNNGVSVGGLLVIGNNDVEVSNLFFRVNLVPKYAAGILINDSVSKIILKNLFFEGTFTHAILLNKCNDIKILNCNFNDVKGYQIMQSWGKQSDNVLVDGNYSNNCDNDFVQLNSEIREEPGQPINLTYPRSKNWIITNNIVKNVGANITDNSFEGRFVAITNTDAVVISNNIFDTCYGDSAFHFESLTGNVIISNNLIKNPNSRNPADSCGLLVFNVNIPETKSKDRSIIFENNVVELEAGYSSNCNRMFYNSDLNNTSIQILNNKFYNNSSLTELDFIQKAFSDKLYNIKNNEFYKFNKVIDIRQGTNRTNIIGNSFYDCNVGVEVSNCDQEENTSIQIEGNVFKNCESSIWIKPVINYNLSLSVNDNHFNTVVDAFRTDWDAKINLLSFKNNVFEKSNLIFRLRSDFLNGFKGNTFSKGSTTNYNDKSIKYNIPKNTGKVIFDYASNDYTYLCWVDIKSSSIDKDRTKILLRVSRNLINATDYNNYVEILDQSRSGNYPMPRFWVNESGLCASIDGSDGKDFIVKVNIIDINGFLVEKEESIGYNEESNDSTPPKIVSKQKSSSIESFDNTISYDEFMNASPNPVKDVLKLESNNEVINIKIYDTNGKLIKDFATNSKTVDVDLSDLPIGLYLGIFQTDKKKTIKKIIKE